MIAQVVRLRAARPLAGLATIAGLVALSGTATASEPIGAPSRDPQRGALHPVAADDDPHDDFAAFPLVVPHDKHWVRAGVQVSALVVLGFVDYLLNTTARGGILQQGDARWDLRYDWPSLRGKLVGTAYELDANKFGTNYLAHPFAGAMYFHVARSNHLSFAESSFLTAAGSTLWEYFGEIRERVSVNDMIVTPVAGVAIGESTMQLAGFFDRGRKNVSNRIASFLLSPIKTLNDLADGAETRRAKDEHLDALGFPDAPWHRFHAYGGAAMTAQSGSVVAGRSTSPATYADARFGLDLELANLPGYRGAARHARLFDDGNASSLRVSGAVSDGHLVDMLFATRVVPVGFYFRDAALDARGDLRGQGSLVGLRMGFEYGVHDFDRDRLRPRDIVSLVSPLGIAAEHTAELGPVRVRTGLDVFGSIAGVAPYALSDHLASRITSEGLPTAVKNHGYYHGVAVGASPFVEVTGGPLRLEAKMRIDSIRAIEGLDEDEAGIDRSIGLSDRRVTARATLAWEPRFAPMSLTLGAERASRSGQVGAASASRSETSLSATLGVLF